VSQLNDTTTEFLDKLAAVQSARGQGRPADFEVEDRSPAGIHETFDRSAIHEDFSELEGKTVAQTMTLVDQNDLIAAMERDVQRSGMSRIRHMAHAIGRQRAHARPDGGVILYSLPNNLVKVQ